MGRILALLVAAVPALAGAAAPVPCTLSAVGGAAEFAPTPGAALVDQRVAVVLSVTCPAGQRWALSAPERTALADVGQVELYADRGLQTRIHPGSPIAGIGSGEAQLVPVVLLYKPASGRAHKAGRYADQIQINLTY